MSPWAVVAWMFRSAAPSVFLSAFADAAEAGAGVQGCGDTAGGADRHVAGLGAQDDRAAHCLGDPDVALGGADLGGAAQAADRDVASEEGEAGARGLVELDRALGALEGDVAEPSDAPEFGAGGLRLDAGAGGQLDGHLDGSGGAVELVLRRGGDPQDAARVGDLGLLCGLHVTALGGVRRAGPRRPTSRPAHPYCTTPGHKRDGGADSFIADTAHRQRSSVDHDRREAVPAPDAASR